VPLSGIVVEENAEKGRWNRFKNKLIKDGFWAALHRLGQVFLLKTATRNTAGLAEKYGIALYRVERFNSNECSKLLDRLKPDLLAIASAPVLKQAIFQKARLGCLNAHPGWLPKYRGRGANAYALKNGDDPGITIHFIDADIDKGKIIIREKVPIQKKDTVSKINDRAVARGAYLMSDVIHQIRKNQLIVPEIKEPHGHNYRSMPYAEVKKVNRKLQKRGGVQ
jgi:methionyl-tRNA formyltransferase